MQEIRNEMQEIRNEMDAILRDLHMHFTFGEIRQFEEELHNAERFMVQLIADLNYKNTL